jgi:hypothetical protein
MSAFFKSCAICIGIGLANRPISRARNPTKISKQTDSFRSYQKSPDGLIPVCVPMGLCLYPTSTSNKHTSFNEIQYEHHTNGDANQPYINGDRFI